MDDSHISSGLGGDPWSNDLDLITSAAQAAGVAALGFFGANPKVRFKTEDRSPVSEADYAANDILKDRLLAARPNYGWLSEETDDDPARLRCETLFVVDPIDGTRAFIAGRDVWCVSVAVVHRGRPVAGVLVAPALKQIYQATLSGPALLNGARLEGAAASGKAQLDVALGEDLLKKMALPARTLIHRVSHVPSLAYRLAMIADGRIDATVVKKNAHDWDLAAADLILARTGGALVDMSSAPLIYNRQSVMHGMLMAGSKHALAALADAGLGDMEGDGTLGH
ncbi:3'(2'),5'-bisphosphate nucleotidase CysQ [Xaviernesmea oryzae]|uniref:3'(2'),5'-bisphosphate nucleotidase CysQ n=1 Tax=Xaviernesmea oryzae TaxID=464029 RepID=UPI0008AC2F32|nr:3'(2'),5'-bisphosphate nucleotidase CysQ [Xaviernesmea oryzae]SEK71409.1 myo-inositol-1(or 4)-monophosphatase [Xaviernesmea oryzae]